MAISFIRSCRRESVEVLYSDSRLTHITKKDFVELKSLAARNPRKRVRLCAHGATTARLHEMLIVHQKVAYVRPHKHSGKSESTHVIEGIVDFVLFDEDGALDRVIECGDYASGKPVYFRMAEPALHTLVIRSDVLVFHEITDGPYDRKDTAFPSWAPDEDDADTVSRFLTDLDKKIKLTQSAKK